MKEKEQIIKIRFWIWPLIFIFVAVIVIWNANPNPSPFGMFLTFMWCFLYLPALIFEVLGFSKGDLKLAGTNPTSKRIILQIPTIARNNTLPALSRTIESILKEAPKFLKNWRVDLITEETAEGLEQLYRKWSKEEKINFLVVPKNYQTKNKTKYKARAHQYALELRDSQDKNTYIYHLDDDSSVSENTIASVAEAAEEGIYLGQGILTFPNHLSENFLTTLCDSVRTGNDLGCFRFFTGVLKSPLIGLHGEHLLIREDIENEIGWDFGENLVEDATFAIEFSKRYPGKSHFLNGFVQCASPSSIGDLIKQRARWFKGMRQILGKIPWKSKILILLRLTPWGLGILGNVIFIYSFSILLFSLNYSFFYPGVIGYPFVLLSALCYSFVVYLYLTGLLINLREEKSMKKKIFYVLSLPFLLPFLGLFEALGALYSIKTKGFVVVEKPR